MRTAQRGLTFIELLVILLVILTLISLAVPPLLNARLRAEVARVQQDLQVVESAVEWYYMDQKRYPESTASNILSDPQAPKDKGLLHLMSPVRYLDSLPEDPFQSGSWVDGSDMLYEFGSGGNPAATGYRVEAWMLVSCGPDGDMDSHHVSTFPLGASALEYNPTNGLRSDGDILRYGGHYMDGNWFLNDRRITNTAP
jgi:general secretion pathway protein G